MNRIANRLKKLAEPKSLLEQVKSLPQNDLSKIKKSLVDRAESWAEDYLNGYSSNYEPDSQDMVEKFFEDVIYSYAEAQEYVQDYLDCSDEDMLKFNDSDWELVEKYLEELSNKAICDKFDEMISEYVADFEDEDLNDKKYGPGMNMHDFLR